MQTLSSVAPPPAPQEGAESARDVSTFAPAQGESQPLRALGWAMVIGGAVGLAFVLAFPKLRPAQAPEQAATQDAPPPAAEASQHPLQASETPTGIEPAAAPQRARQTKRAASAGATRATATAQRTEAAGAAKSAAVNIRVRTRVAPVRVAPEPNAKVVCSLKRGAVMRSLQQTPDAKSRWFAVQCGKSSSGWVHENFVSVRP